MPNQFGHRNEIPLLTSLLGLERSPTLPTVDRVAMSDLNEAISMAKKNQDQERLSNLLMIQRMNEQPMSQTDIINARMTGGQPVPNMQQPEQQGWLSSIFDSIFNKANPAQIISDELHRTNQQNLPQR